MDCLTCSGQLPKEVAGEFELNCPARLPSSNEKYLVAGLLLPNAKGFSAASHRLGVESRLVLGGPETTDKSTVRCRKEVTCRGLAGNAFNTYFYLAAACLK